MHDVISSQGTVEIDSFAIVSLCFIATKPHLAGIRHDPESLNLRLLTHLVLV